MNSLVVLAVLGCACASAFVQYTPAVAAERARFAQLFKAQAAAAAAAPDPGHHHTGAYNHHAPTHNYNQHTTKWTGPVAATVPAGLPGSTSQVGYTADVSAARSAFLAAYKAQVAATTGHKTGHHHTGAYNHHANKWTAPAYTPQKYNAPTHHHYNAIPTGTQKWTGPMAATVPAGVNGQITPVGDTPEVAAARNAFFNTYRAELSSTQPISHNQGQWTAPRPAQTQWTAPQPAQARWTGPMAATVPAGVHGATHQVHQTADVASATAAFHQAYNAAVAATTGRRY